MGELRSYFWLLRQCAWARVFLWRRGHRDVARRSSAPTSGSPVWYA